MTTNRGTPDDDAVRVARPLGRGDVTPSDDAGTTHAAGETAGDVEVAAQERLDRLAAPLGPRAAAPAVRGTAPADTAPADAAPSAIAQAGIALEDGARADGEHDEFEPAFVEHDDHEHGDHEPAALGSTAGHEPLDDTILAASPAPTPRPTAAASVTAPVTPPPPPPSLFMPSKPVDAATPAAPLPASLALADAPRRGRGPRTMIVVTLTLAVLIGLCTYLLVAARALEQRNDEWELVARSMGQDLAQARDDLAGALAELDGTRAQLRAAQNRITELADEKAQLGDDREVQQRVVDYQAKVSEAARKVTTALTSCVDGQNKLIEYLQDPSLYDAADLARFRTDVTRVCAAASDANTSLQEVLER